MHAANIFKHTSSAVLGALLRGWQRSTVFSTRWCPHRRGSHVINILEVLHKVCVGKLGSPVLVHREMAGTLFPVRCSVPGLTIYCCLTVCSRSKGWSGFDG